MALHRGLSSHGGACPRRPHTHSYSLIVPLAGAMVAAVQSSWFRRGAKGQLLPVLLATLPLTAKAAEEQALLGSLKHTPPQVGHGFLNLCFWGLSCPGGPGNPSKRWGAKHPIFWKGFRGPGAT